MDRYYIYLCFGDTFVPGPDPTKRVRRTELKAIATNEFRATEWLNEQLSNQSFTLDNPFPNIPMFRVQKVEMLR